MQHPLLKDSLYVSISDRIFAARMFIAARMAGEYLLIDIPESCVVG